MQGVTRWSKKLETDRSPRFRTMTRKLLLVLLASALVPARGLVPTLARRAALRVLTGGAAGLLLEPVVAAAAAEAEEEVRYRRLPNLQFIAALGDPKSSTGDGAETWGLWREDPGPRGVRLGAGYEKLVSNGGVAPAGWQFDDGDWWLEEHGLIMSAPPPLPLKKGGRPMHRYVVTGDRETTAILTVHDSGKWELSKVRMRMRVRDTGRKRT